VGTDTAMVALHATGMAMKWAVTTDRACCRS